MPCDLVQYQERYLSFEIEKESSHVFEQTSAIGSHCCDESLVEMEETDVNTAKDAADKCGKIGFSNDFTFFNVLESEDVWIEKCLIWLLRV